MIGLCFELQDMPREPCPDFDPGFFDNLWALPWSRHADSLVCR